MLEERFRPNPLLFFVVLAGCILAATGNLSTWWGIAIVVAIAVVAAFSEILSDVIEELDALTDVLIVLPAFTAGVFVGHAVFDAWWGVILGALVLALVASIPAGVLQAALERRAS